MNETPSPAGNLWNQQFTTETLWKMIYAGNPFYLISAALILGAVSSSLDASNLQTATWIPLAIIVSYTLLTAAALIFLVRWGKVWDDARSLMMITLILLLVLSVCSDSEMMDSFQSGFARGLAGFVFSLIVLETVRRQLRIRLPKHFAAVSVLMLALLFLLPVRVAAFARAKFDPTGLIWGFALAGSAILLAYLPAVLHSGEENGTPWKKSFFPGCIIWIFAAAVMVRTYLMTISFIPGRGAGNYTQLETDFRFAMIAPAMAVTLVLLTEYLLRHGSEWERKLLVFSPLPLLIPALFSLQNAELDPVTLSAPALALGLMVWQRIRGVRYGEIWLAYSLFLVPYVCRFQLRTGWICFGLGIAVMLVHTLVNRRKFGCWCHFGIYTFIAVMAGGSSCAEHPFVILLPVWCCALLYFLIVSTIFVPEKNASDVRTFTLGMILFMGACAGLAGKEAAIYYSAMPLAVVLLAIPTLFWKRNTVTKVFFWLCVAELILCGGRLLLTYGSDLLVGYAKALAEYLWRYKAIVFGLVFFLIALGVSLHKAVRRKKDVSEEK
ncbi:MAG: hypothetical protein IJS14_13080 [Lentisphaeria bacterium]|nr:hypothetical protein [Lentisphaeria bacterium]